MVNVDELIDRSWGLFWSSSSTLPENLNSLLLWFLENISWKILHIGEKVGNCPLLTLLWMVLLIALLFYFFPSGFWLCSWPTIFCLPAGNPDPYSWLRSDEGMVPRDPRETTGPQHHGLSKQQHSGYARWIFPCMQDWTVKNQDQLHHRIWTLFPEILQFETPPFLKSQFI